MTRNAVLLMALMLVAATAASTAAAFAEPKKEQSPRVDQVVAESVQQTSEALLLLRLKTARPYQPNRPTTTFSIK
jgi:hypothetical protein